MPNSTASPILLTIIPHLEGVEVPHADGIQLQTLKPGCRARMVEITDSGLTRDDLDEGEITFNSKAWRITSHRLMPGPEGELRGEVMLLLSDDL